MGDQQKFPLAVFRNVIEQAGIAVPTASVDQPALTKSDYQSWIAVQWSWHLCWSGCCWNNGWCLLVTGTGAWNQNSHVTR